MVRFTPNSTTQMQKQQNPPTNANKIKTNKRLYLFLFFSVSNSTLICMQNKKFPNDPTSE